MRKTTIATFIFSLGILTFAVGCNDANVANVGNARSNNAAVVTNANRTVTNTAPAANRFIPTLRRRRQRPLSKARA